MRPVLKSRFSSTIRRLSSSANSLSSLPPYMTISEEVRAALAEKKAVVALESTIISHGMPYPDNIQVLLFLL
ncbi:hypothetical protein EON63_20425 [archaeon]|nr:MAG: hypothetical protein EON63_20425 [archaeon]